MGRDCKGKMPKIGIIKDPANREAQPSRVTERAKCGVSAVAQWVKNLIAVAQVSAEAQVQSPAWHIKGSIIAAVVAWVTAAAQI